MRAIIVALLLSGCTKISYKTSKVILPDMPIAGHEAATELENACPDKKCPNLYKYFNKLYIFRVQYLRYKEELAK